MTNYRREWEPIGDALRRIVRAGLPEEEAKIALCEEISDGKIGLRQELAADRSRGFPKTSFDGLPDGARLSPDDIDWTNSRPSLPPAPIWRHASHQLGEPVALYIKEKQHLMNRTVARIEVRADDITRVFCKSQEPSEIAPSPGREAADPNPSSGSPEKPPTRGAKSRSIGRAIQALYPDGIPVIVGSQQYEAQINDWLESQGLPTVNPVTIRRFLKSQDSGR